MKTFLLLLVAYVTLHVGAHAQQLNIEPYLARIQNGDAAGVQSELPSLMNQYPNSPDVLYLQAVLTTDGSEAARLYQNVVDNYPKSEWADDALFKVYKFYQAIGLFRTAELKLIQLRSNYPDSKYAGNGVAGNEQPETPKTTEPAPPPVTVETPTETRPAETAVPSPGPKVAPASKFALQVGVYSTRSNANKQKAFFEYQKFQADIVSKMKGSKELFVVLVGGYGTADEARAQGEEIKRSFKIEYLVVTR